MKTPKDRFFEEMEKLFVGADVEGNSGYVKLMKIKSAYYKKILKPEIEREMDELKESFKNEAYTKLYTFFSRYFSESGSIYFVNTRYHDKVYANLADDRRDENYKRLSDPNRDVFLFWKTKGLYYIKTDRLYVSMDVEIEVDGRKATFHFDASEFEGKRNNEKISLIYEFAGVDEKGVITLKVKKSERGKKTKIEDIVKKAKKAGIKHITEEHVRKAIRKFEMQSEVDYFIHKNVRSFLKEQFDLYIKTYLMDDETIFKQDRLDQLKKLRKIAHKIIDYIAQFEDELVRIWNKPRFVRNAHYVITLDRIWEKDGGREIVKEIIDSLEKERPQFVESVEKLGDIGKKIRERYEKALNSGVKDNQLLDWYLLGIIDKDFDPSDIINPGNLAQDESLNEKWKHLPIDTKYFPDLEEKIIALFDNLDDALDGWLIHSENYQALNTILPKWKEKVQTIYIDPPFNTGKDFDYVDGYQDSTWLTLMENRLRLAKEIMCDTALIYLHLDKNADMLGRLLLDDIFDKNLVNEIIWFFGGTTNSPYKFADKHDLIWLYSKNEKYNFFADNVRLPFSENTKFMRDENGKIFRYWSSSRGKYYPPQKLVNGEWVLLGKYRYDVITDVPSMSTAHGEEWLDFPTQKKEALLKIFLLATSNPGDLVLDFFLGSGTTTAVAHKLRRRWIGIEMGDHFWTVVLPRMKKVLFYDKSGISKEKEVKEHYNEKNAGGFFKYYELEQYEGILRKMKYTEAEELFDKSGNVLSTTPNPLKDYIFMLDKKMIEGVYVPEDTQSNVEDNVYVNLRDIYPDVDVPETISNVTGRKIEWIKDGKFKLEGLKKPIAIAKVPVRYAKRLLWWGTDS